jgi:hypothetical protein
LIIRIAHAGNGHLDAPLLAAFGVNIDGVLGFGSQVGRMFAKDTALSAKGAAESLVAISAQYFLALVTGNVLGFRVEKKDAPVHVMGNNPLLEIIQDAFEIIPVAYQIF